MKHHHKLPRFVVAMDESHAVTSITHVNGKVLLDEATNVLPPVQLLDILTAELCKRGEHRWDTPYPTAPMPEEDAA